MADREKLFEIRDLDYSGKERRLGQGVGWARRDRGRGRETEEGQSEETTGDGEHGFCHSCHFSATPTLR